MTSHVSSASLRQGGAGGSRRGRAVFLIGRLAPAWRNLDDARLVDDAGAAVALLHDADDPRSSGRALTPHALALHLRAELGGLLSREAHQESACVKQTTHLVNHVLTQLAF